MSSEWTTLAQINFLIHRRLSERLDSALTALEHTQSEQAQERAIYAVSAARELYRAWTNLIRFKAGEAPAFAGGQQIDACYFLQWIAAELNMSHIPDCDEREALNGNLESVQEALVALRSCAQTLGPHAHIQVQRHERGFWVRVRYGRSNSSPETLEELMAGLRDNWRLETAAFELHCAYDFLKMNDIELFYSMPDQYCELAFFLPFTQQRNRGPSAREKAKTLLDSYNAPDTYEVITD